ncbi:hypothetical protein BC939DRAFT_491804 [Gamsiella multidivaricata]|uniref:uncharacterized protein n=1 Tax=Gamsiella multidivaricata TaxID=101098 RepID=UPI00221E5155|nr:uncharacterized protein BC939DRAFT_491804 [Gamsiella multidivaricata]KAI7826131.1 hypothetical protein BC939DRAFT_491804 [Gamsiella multidivaricata]
MHRLASDCFFFFFFFFFFFLNGMFFLTHSELEAIWSAGVTNDFSRFNLTSNSRQPCMTDKMPNVTVADLRYPNLSKERALDGITSIQSYIFLKQLLAFNLNHFAQRKRNFVSTKASVRTIMGTKTCATFYYV